MSATTPHQPWMYEGLTPSRRADLLLPRLTVDQKMAQVSCYFPVDITDTSDLRARFPHGVGEVSCLEARDAVSLDEVTEFQHRVQRDAMEASGHGIPAILHMEGVCGAFLPGATSFPSGLGRASSWDVELERRVGQTVGRQERAVGITHTLAPVLDVSRDPRMGRHGETYGEDPTLAAALGVAYTQGVQGGGELGLHTEAVAKHFVGSHHTEGGIHGAHADVPERLLLEVYSKPFQAAISRSALRGVMPCYNSVAGEPASSSTHLLTTLLREQMGFEGLVVSDYGAVGNLHGVQRVAESLGQAGLMAMRRAWTSSSTCRPASARSSGSGSSPGPPRSRSWTAPSAASSRRSSGWVSSSIRSQPQRTSATASFHDPADAQVALQSARESLVLLRNDGSLPLRDVRTLAVIGCHATSARFFFGGYTHYSMAEGKLAVNSSMAGLATRNDNRGTPMETIPGTTIEASDRPVFEDLLQQQQPGIRTLLDELRLRLPGTDVLWAWGYPFAGADSSGHDEALAVAVRADLVLLTLGGKHGTASIASMGEGIDATDINLPACQEDLIEKLSALGKPMVGVHLDGRPITSDVADARLGAIIEAWSPAEAGAQAIVDVLTGTAAPSGRLPVSVARSAGQVPVYYNHPHGSSWHQGESIGFADYVDAPHTPRYPFGHGLSYTTFEYADLDLSARDVQPNSELEIGVTVTNTGDRTGCEVVQLYLSDRYASASRPVLELAGFQRVSLEAGQSARVGFRLAVSQTAFVAADGCWHIEAGDVDIYVGASSEDLRLTESIRVVADAVVDPAARGFFADVLPPRNLPSPTDSDVMGATTARRSQDTAGPGRATAAEHGSNT